MGEKQTIIGRIQRIIDQRGDEDALKAMGSAGESWKPSDEPGKEKGLPLFVEGMVEESSPFSASGDNPVTVNLKDYTIVPMRGVWNGLKIAALSGLQYSYTGGKAYLSRYSYDLESGIGTLPVRQGQYEDEGEIITYPILIDAFFICLKSNGNSYSIEHINEGSYNSLSKREKNALLLLAYARTNNYQIVEIKDLRPLFRPNNGIDSGLSVYPNGGLYFNLTAGRVYLDSKIENIAEPAEPVGPLENNMEYFVSVWLNDDGQAELRYEDASNEPTGMYALLAKITTADGNITEVEDLRFFVNNNRVEDTNDERDGLEISVYGTTQYRFTNGKVLLGGVETDVINDDGILEGIQVQENDPIGLRYKYSAGSAHINGQTLVVPDKVKNIVLIAEGTHECEVEHREALEYRVNKGYAYVNGEMARVRVKDYLAPDNAKTYVYVNDAGEVVHDSNPPTGDYTDLAVVTAAGGTIVNIQDKRNPIPNKTYYVYIDGNANVVHSEEEPTGEFANLATLEIIDGDIQVVTDTRIILASEELAPASEFFVYVDASGKVVHGDALPESGNSVRLAKITTEDAIVSVEDLRPYDGTLNGCEVTANSPGEGIFFNYSAGQAYIDGDFVEADAKLGHGPIRDGRTTHVYIRPNGNIEYSENTPTGEFAEMADVVTANNQIESVTDTTTPVGGFNGVEYGFEIENISGLSLDVTAGTVYVNDNRIHLPPVDPETSQAIGRYTLPNYKPIVYIYIKEDSTTPPVPGNIVVDTVLPNDRQAVVIAIASTSSGNITSLHDMRPLLLDEWNQIRDNADGSSFDPFLMNCEQLWQDIRTIQNDKFYDDDGNWWIRKPNYLGDNPPEGLFAPDLMNSRMLWDSIRAMENNTRIDGTTEGAYTTDPENVDDLFDKTEMNCRQLWDDIRAIEDNHGDETVGIDYDAAVMNVRHLHNDVRLLENNDGNETSGNPYNPTEMNAKLFHFLIHSLEDNFEAETAGIPYDPDEMNVRLMHFDLHSIEDNFGTETAGIAYDPAVMNMRVYHHLIHSLEDNSGVETVGIAYDASVMNNRRLHNDIRELEIGLNETRAGTPLASASFVPSSMNNVALYEQLAQVSALGVPPHDYYLMDGVWEGCEPSYIQGVKGGRQAQYAVSAGTVKVALVDVAVSAKSATNLTSGSVNWVYFDSSGTAILATTNKGDIEPEDIPIAVYNVNSDNQITYAVDVRGFVRTLEGVVDGLEVSDNGGLQIAYTDGSVFLARFDFSISGSTVSLTDDSLNYVYVDRGGNVQASVVNPADFDGVRRGADIYQSGDMQITYSSIDAISNGNVYDSIAAGTIDFYDNFYPVDNYVFVNEDGGIEYFRNDPSQNYVVSGGYVSNGGGLQADYSLINAYVDGVNYPSIAGGSVTLPPNKDSYIYVDDNQRVGYSHRNPGDNVIVNGGVVSPAGNFLISWTAISAKTAGEDHSIIAGTVDLSANDTFYIYVDDTGSVVSSISHPDGDYALIAIVVTHATAIDTVDNDVKNNWIVTILAKVTTDGTSITNIEDKRVYTQFSVVSTDNGAITDIQDVRNGGQIARHGDYTMLAYVTTESGSIAEIEDARQYSTFHFNQTLYNHKTNGVEVGLEYDSTSGLDFTFTEGVAYVFGNRFEYPDTTITLTANTRNHVYIDNEGNVVAYEYSAIMDKPVGEYALLFVVVTGAASVDQYIDVRPILRQTIDALKDNEDGTGFDPYTMNAKKLREDVDAKAEDTQNYTVTSGDQTAGFATITHDLGRYPIVQVILSSNNKVDFTADIEHTSVNEFKVNNPNTDDTIVYI